MRLELVSIETDTHPLDGACYEPEGGAAKGAVLIMHGNCKNFYTGVSRTLPPLLTRLGYACLAYNRRGHDVLRNVARIEPLVSPSQVWVTERFKDALERTPSFYHAEPIEADVRPELRSSDGTFNVKKPNSLEEDHFLRLFRIVEPRR